MLDHKVRLYYYAKSLIPRRVQIAIRGRLVRRKWEKSVHLWPMHGNAGGAPEGWPGWPEDKKFALVLTHDIETKEGVGNVLRIADLEEKFGFRSVFNFVAEEYHTPPRILDELRARGFEIGVHGLYHNSLLYHSREEFLKQAPRINRILTQWGAVGFRSPCMYHNLEWLHDLDIQYDASTFDTDPFEPQPDGVHTIFPLHIAAEGEKKGYVELPYTLPQDFTLFILMKNRTIEIWRRKLEWIVRNGGMALVVTHPDYMRFEGEKASYAKYDVNNYREFLNHIVTDYGGRYWNALPREVAGFWAALPADRTDAPCGRTHDGARPRVSGRGGGPSIRRSLNTCMVAYTFYEEDGRVRRYAEALAKRGDRVDVVALKHKDLGPYDRINGVNVYRIQSRIINEKSKFSYLFRILKFLIRSGVFITGKHSSNRYDLVHVHSVPDFEVFAALLPKITGAKVILDIHDIVPEFYAAKFKVKPGCFVYNALQFLEKLSIRFSDHVIISNHLWETKLINRSAPRDKITTFINYPDSVFFRTTPRSRSDKFMVLYPGSLNWHQGLDIAIRAFSSVYEKIAGAEFQIYGAGPETNNLRAMVESMGLEKKVLFKEPLPIDEISKVMADATVGVVPKRNDDFGGEAFSTKVLEFMALGVPVILSRTRIDSHYFNDSIARFFEPENDEALAECLLLLARDEEKRNALAVNALDFVSKLGWESKKDDYFSLIDRLIRKSSG